jgi:hypothetical protein
VGILRSFVGPCLLLSCALAIGCEDDEGDLGGTGGTGGTSSGGTGGSTTGGGGSGGSDAATGGSGGASGSAGSAGNAGSAGVSGAAGGGGTAGATGACNYLTQLGSEVIATITAGQAPQPTGGPIVDGFYRLTAVKLYGGATGTNFLRTLKVDPGELKTVERDGTSTIDKTTTGTYSVNGSQITRELTCPAPASITFGFTTSTGKFTAYESQGGNKVVELSYDYDSPI